MEFREFGKGDIPEAAKLLAERHRKERRIFFWLNKEFEDPKNTEKVLSELFREEQAIGVCAFEKEELVGFVLSKILTEGPFGRCAFVPYEGSALRDSASPELYRELYAQIAPLWIARGVLAHYVQVPAANEEVLNAWLKLSFAFQQVYAIRGVSPQDVPAVPELTIRSSTEKDSDHMRKISDLIWSHQAQSPTYAPVSKERIEEIRNGYGELVHDKDEMVLLAFQKEELVGFLCANLPDEDAGMMAPDRGLEISIAGTVPGHRGKGIGTLLTQTMMNKAWELNRESLVLDYRIANLQSSNFWPGMGFRPFAYRMYRLIDDRCLPPAEPGTKAGL